MGVRLLSRMKTVHPPHGDSEIQALLSYVFPSQHLASRVDTTEKRGHRKLTLTSMCIGPEANSFHGSMQLQECWKREKIRIGES
jgi:hypothetical protein